MWLHTDRTFLEFSTLSASTDNVFIESTDGSLRDEGFYLRWLENLDKAGGKLGIWGRTTTKNVLSGYQQLSATGVFG